VKNLTAVDRTVTVHAWIDAGRDDSISPTEDDGPGFYRSPAGRQMTGFRLYPTAD